MWPGTLTLYQVSDFREEIIRLIIRLITYFCNNRERLQVSEDMLEIIGLAWEFCSHFCIIGAFTIMKSLSFLVSIFWRKASSIPHPPLLAPDIFILG